jgi:transglutaminase-like putative cysteine protease
MQRAERRAVLQAPLSWTLAGVLAAVALHAAHLPLWVLATFVLLVLWRVLIGLRSSRLPSRTLRIAAVIAVVVAVSLGYRTLNGVDAGTALLALMAAMKLLETRNARDQLVLLLIAYFLVLAAFLYGQQLWLLPIAAGVIWLITASLLRVAHAAAPLRPGAILGRSGAMLVQAVPIMLLLFLLFPRVPGPFWALPTAQHAMTGLGDEMAPGDITELSLSSDVAFRVRFHGVAPPPAQRYWRGPVLHDFDGYTWRHTRGFFRPGVVETRGPEYDYSLMLEPMDNYWVFALDMPVHWSEHSRISQTGDYQLIAQDRIAEPVTYELSSRPQYSAAAGHELSEPLSERDRRLPPDRNQRTQALALDLRAATANNEAYIDEVLNMFREQSFYYTLSPSRLDYDSVDDFLFNTRRGFCAHYASAFTTLMRAAGIPARVVTGYQGGEYNRLAGYYIVRQSDAHAWSEVWLAGRGWVRFDPTAAVAPERIERGTAGALGAEPFAERMIRGNAWLADVRFAWDAANTLWRENVIQFSAQKQEEFLEWLLDWLGVHQPDWRYLAALLAGGIAVALALLSLVLARELRFRSHDPVQRAYARFCHRLERRGLERLRHEGPLDFLARIQRARPDLATDCEPIARLYIALRYAGEARRPALQELLRRVRAFRPAARPS